MGLGKSYTTLWLPSPCIYIYITSIRTNEGKEVKGWVTSYMYLSVHVKDLMYKWIQFLINTCMYIHCILFIIFEFKNVVELDHWSYIKAARLIIFSDTTSTVYFEHWIEHKKLDKCNID